MRFTTSANLHTKHPNEDAGVRLIANVRDTRRGARKRMQHRHGKYARTLVALIARLTTVAVPLTTSFPRVSGYPKLIATTDVLFACLTTNATGVTQGAGVSVSPA